MRQNLENSRKDAGVRDSIRAIRGNIETIFWKLSHASAGAESAPIEPSALGWYSAPTKSTLPPPGSVPETALGRVTEGTQRGMICCINPTRTSWVAINFLE